MKTFLALLAALDAADGRRERVAALVEHFAHADPADAAWAVALLLGLRPARILDARRLRALLARVSDLPEWLVEVCHAHAGDLAETAAALFPGGDGEGLPPLARLVEEELLPLSRRSLSEREEAVLALWSRARREERFALNKLLTGGWRLGVARGILVQALARHAGLEEWRIAERLAGDWRPSAASFAALLAEGEQRDPARPYPFFLAAPLPGAPAELGEPSAWFAEWKWDGMRAQLLRRGTTLAIWSRGGERIEERFPELVSALAKLPRDAVLDGELLVWGEGRPRPFAELQRRLQRRRPSRRLLAELPVRFLAFDLLECEGEDLRPRPLAERRERLRRLIDDVSQEIELSDCFNVSEWDELAALRAHSRALGVEGLMLKRKDSAYGVGRVRGDWWKWKVDPFAVDAVLLYAEPGHGRRAGLLTDYTFGVRDADGQWVPIAKAYSGLTEEEIVELDRWLRRHTRQRFGPVRQVEPRWVFALGFEGIAPSARHRAGLALRFPRILRWRRDLDPSAADTLDAVRALLGH